jgi:hypothetical protein
MAVKKKAATKTSGASATKTKAAPKKAAKAAPASKPAVASETTSKAGTPKAKAGAAKKAAPKKAAAVKLTDRQLDLLKAVHGTKEGGYLADKKAEAKTLDALASKKLIKKGAKDKASGHVRYHVSKAGEKHVASASQSPSA